MSENEIARRLEEFTAEEKEIYSRPVSGLDPVTLILYLGFLFAIVVMSAFTFVDDKSAQIALLAVSVSAAVATAITALANYRMFKSQSKLRDAQLERVADRRRQFLREQ